MTTARPYRGPMTPEQAIEQLVRGKGTQFEAGPVDAFIAVLAEADHGYRLGTLFTDFEAAARAHVELVQPGRIRRARHRRLSPAHPLPITLRQCLRLRFN